MFENPNKLILARPILLVILVVALGACTSEESEQVIAEGSSVVIGLLGEPKTLNPLVATSAHSQDIINLLFQKLMVEQEDFLTFTPALAERWSFSEDSLSITFFLSKNAVWQDGEPISSADIRFTWRMQTDTLSAWAGRNLKEKITDVEVVDDHTVVFHFSSRYPYQLMDANDGVILPRHILEKVPREAIRTSDFGRNPVGNGPYRLARWVPGQYIELVRNPSFFIKGQPYLDRVVFRIVPDITNLVTQLKAGEIDCLESIPTDAIDELKSDYPDVNLYHYRSRSMSFIVWNLQNELFAHREVRHALAMAINAPEIIETLWGGMAEVSDSPMHPMLWAHDPKMSTIPFDPDRSIEILAGLGWSDTDGDGVLDKGGRAFEFEMTTNQGIQVRADVMTMVQEYLRRIGVKVNARILEWNTFIDGVVKGNFESCVLGWKVSTRADLSNFWHSTATPPQGFNASRYKNPQADVLMERAKNAENANEARVLWYECQRIIYDDQPIFFLAVPHEVVGLARRYCDVRPNAQSFFVNLPRWRIDENCQ
ncbi:MAG: peptide-binding protein [Candidatus Krumholzibacteria bacterium]|nr:peptide-binding protein [Candidatus Krumholzibacteria bacterium]